MARKPSSKSRRVSRRRRASRRAASGRAARRALRRRASRLRRRQLSGRGSSSGSSHGGSCYRSPRRLSGYRSRGGFSGAARRAAHLTLSDDSAMYRSTAGSSSVHRRSSFPRRGRRSRQNLEFQFRGRRSKRRRRSLSRPSIISSGVSGPSVGPSHSSSQKSRIVSSTGVRGLSVGPYESSSHTSRIVSSIGVRGLSVGPYESSSQTSRILSSTGGSSDDSSVVRLLSRRQRYQRYGSRFMRLLWSIRQIQIRKKIKRRRQIRKRILKFRQFYNKFGLDDSGLSQPASCANHNFKSFCCPTSWKQVIRLSLSVKKKNCVIVASQRNTASLIARKKIVLAAIACGLAYEIKDNE